VSPAALGSSRSVREYQDWVVASGGDSSHHTEQIGHGPLTFKDRMALPPISVRSVSPTCTVPSCPYRSMHALDELQERGRALVQRPARRRH
jgi:hypothetical protein